MTVVAEQSIRIVCPNLTCRALLSVPTSARGRIVRCRQCGMNIKIPTPQARDTQPAPDRKKSA